MSDNPQVSPAPLFRLGFGVLALHGADAVKFAHAQCMSDVAGLVPGHWQWSGWLTPKGRLIALFALAKFDEQTLWLVLPDADAAGLAAQLRRFVFRSKLAIEVRDDLVAAGAFATPTEAQAARLAGDPERGVELDMGAAGGPRRLRIASEPVAEDPAALACWNRFDLEHGLPRLEASQREQWTPQMLSLDRLRAYSVKKGCYPGQEIVARTHFLGQAKRGLVLLAADAPLATGTALHAGEAPVGEIVCAAGDADGWRALAVAQLDAAHAQENAWTADGVQVSPLPLQGGLARTTQA
jgi:folate-binding protein YgfZ